MTPAPHRRGQIRELLQLLASEEEQLAYEHIVPHVDITAELDCWHTSKDAISKGLRHLRFSPPRHLEGCHTAPIAGLQESGNRNPPPDLAPGSERPQRPHRYFVQ